MRGAFVITAFAGMTERYNQGVTSDSLGLLSVLARKTVFALEDKVARVQ